MWPTHRHAIDGAFGDESCCEKIPRELEEGGVSPGHLPESERLATFGNADSVRMSPIGDLLASDEVPPPAEAQQGCIGQYGLEKPPVVPQEVERWCDGVQIAVAVAVAGDRKGPQVELLGGANPGRNPLPAASSHCRVCRHVS